MNKPTQLVVLALAVPLLAGCPRSAADPPHPAQAEYDALVARSGGDEPAVRDELNDLIASGSASVGAADQTRVNALTRECLDPRALLDIEHVRTFLGPAGRGEAPPFHFVSDAHRARLQALAGETPTPDKVLATRKALARLGAEFALIRQPPDWNIKIEGEPLKLPFLDLLREAHEFLRPGRHPELRPEPRIPTFSGAEGELLAQLERYFNGPRARAAFPPDKFPNLYVHGRIPAVPTALDQYRPQVAAHITKEMELLTPEANPDPEKVQHLNETNDQLGRFLEVVAEFGK